MQALLALGTFILSIYPSSSALGQEAQPVVCDFDLEALGVKQVHSVPVSQITPGFEQSYLRAWLFRIAPGDGRNELRSSADVEETTYRDIILLFHMPPEALEAELGRWMAQIGAMGAIKADARCDYRQVDSLSIYEPFVEESERAVRFTPTILAFSRETAARLEPGELVALAPPDDPIGDLATDQQAPPAESGTWQRNYYPWIPELDFAHLATGEDVFALDRIDCDRKGNFLIGSVGQFTDDATANVPTGKVAVSRREMIAANAYFGVSGDPEDEASVEASVNQSAYWCIPKREFCHQQVGFGDFGIEATDGEIDEFEATNVVSLRHGLVKAMQRLIMDNCPQTTIEQGVK